MVIGAARNRASGAPLPPGFGTIWVTVAVDLVGFGIVLPILPLYAEDFGASPAVIGVLVASFSVAQLLFAPIWGRVSDRIGRKPVLIVSLVGTAVGSLLTGVAGSLWVLFAGRIIDGASGASVSVAQAAVTDVARPTSDRVCSACSAPPSVSVSWSALRSAAWPPSGVPRSPS